MNGDKKILDACVSNTKEIAPFKQAIAALPLEAPERKALEESIALLDNGDPFSVRSITIIVIAHEHESVPIA